MVLIIQYTVRMRRMISVACPALPLSSTLSHKQRDFRVKLLNVRSVFWFSLQLVSETFPILRRNQRDTALNVHKSSCNVPVVRVRF